MVNTKVMPSALLLGVHCTMEHITFCSEVYLCSKMSLLASIVLLGHVCKQVKKVSSSQVGLLVSK